MDKRSYSLISPKKMIEVDSCKKLKVSTLPRNKGNENNGNTLNFLDSELNDLCFEDDDEEFYNKVAKIVLIKIMTKFILMLSYLEKTTLWTCQHLNVAPFTLLK